jgi:hypothetical protein
MYFELHGKEQHSITIASVVSILNAIQDIVHLPMVVNLTAHLLKDYQFLMMMVVIVKVILNVLLVRAFQINADLTAQAQHLSHIIANVPATQTVALDIVRQIILARILVHQLKELVLIMMPVIVQPVLIVFLMNAHQVYVHLIALELVSHKIANVL